ncbi:MULTISPECIES: hypothetical protein [unclassified Archaeoglobus]|jgi:hypothetical protein|uniref:hypothetical protein n=1 Tax=unclassified Archaeoglobus TaxID=2643606 RepID=UPI0025BE854E|nr:MULTISPECIES: hypothetical protein [unclassified Archaeoglobus]
MITYKKLLDELKREVGPIAKIFLNKAMESLGYDDIDDSNYREVLEILKMNKELREYVEIVEKRLETED